MTIKQLISKVSVLLFILLSVILGGAIYGLFALNNKLEAAVSDSKLSIFTINESRAAQIAFQRQVQDWKNILIRGNDYELYQKYFKGFKHQSEIMDEKLNLVKSKLDTNSAYIKDIDSLLDAHAKLNKTYVDTLSNTWTAADMQTGQKVDMQLRGIDRDTSAKMDKLADDLQKDADTKLNILDESAEKITKQVQYLIVGIAVLGFIMLRIVLKSAYKNLITLIGAEPVDLNKSISAIASGDLTTDIVLKTGDKQSMAANMALMQRKMKNMVTSVKNGIDELEGTHDKISASDKKDIDTLVLSARKLARGVRTAADRFQV